MRNKKSSCYSILANIMILVLTITTATGCSSRNSETVKVRIGYEAILSDYTFFVAYENGYFKDEGLDVEVIKFNTTNEQLLALLSGQVDMIPNSSMALLLSAEVEHPGRFTVFMAHGDLGNKILVRNDSSITTVEQLSEAKIGTFPGTTMFTYANISLAPYFNPSKFPTIIGMQPPNLVEALTSGQVDAIYAVEPIVSVAIHKAGAREIMNNPLGNIMSPFTGGASVLRKKFVDEHPNESAAIIRAMNRAVDYIRENDSESRAILAKYTGFENELLQSSTLGYIWKLDEIDRDAIQRLAEILANAGVVEEEVDTANWYYLTDK